MEELGDVLHLAKSGRLIVKLREKVQVNTLVLDEKGRKIGKIAELIGPVSSPYASVIPLTDRVKRYIGKKVFKG
ncbi:MAG: Gar1/Naf1 family protein [Nitrososphaerales archaeon]